MVHLQFEASQVQVEVIAPAQLTFRDATVALTRSQLPRPVQPRSSAPDTSSSGQDLSSSGAGSPSAPSQSPHASASTSADTTSKERRPRLPCPVCHRAEHLASSDCAFFVWRKGEGKVSGVEGQGECVRGSTPRLAGSTVGREQRGDAVSALEVCCCCQFLCAKIPPI